MSALTTRQTRLSLVLAVCGALVLMAGFVLALTGAIAGAGKPGGWSGMRAGLMLMAVGLALGTLLASMLLVRAMRSAAVRSAAMTAGPWRVAALDSTAPGWPAADPARPDPGIPADAAAESAAGRAATFRRDREPADRAPQRYGGQGVYGSADPAEEWFSSLRAGGIQPVSAAVRQAAASRDTPAEARGPADRAGIGYSDEGWRLDSAWAPHGPPPPARPFSEARPFSVARPLSADSPAVPDDDRPSQEIHHPVRAMPAPRAPGQRLGDETGQIPAYGADPGQDSAAVEPGPGHHARGSRGRRG